MPNTETNREAFKKIVNPGTVLVGKVNRQVYCKIEFDGKRLSISGVVGPKANGDAFGGAGQVCDEVARVNHSSRGWSAPLRREFVRTWRQWHLNDMRAGCEHQRAEGWDQRPIDPAKPTNTYGKHFEGQRQDSWNMLVWVRRDEHPQGLLSQPCPTCGYKYGSGWLFEEIPDEVLTFLRGLPDTSSTPAWV